MKFPKLDKIVDLFDLYCKSTDNTPTAFSVVETVIGDLASPRGDVNPLLFYGRAAFRGLVSYRKYKLHKDSENFGNKDLSLCDIFIEKNDYSPFRNNSIIICSFIFSIIKKAENFKILNFPASKSFAAETLAIFENEDFSIAMIVPKTKLSEISYYRTWIKGDSEKMFSWLRECFWQEESDDFGEYPGATFLQKVVSGESVFLPIRKNLQPKYLCEDIEDSFSNLLKMRLNAFYNKGIRRSVLLHGLPGTGKSTFARSLFSNKKSRTLHLSIDAARSYETTGMINILAPNIIIFDDIDRDLEEAEKILQFFEEVAADVIIASVNNISVLDSALLRPGRFDEIYLMPLPSIDYRRKLISLYWPEITPEVLEAISEKTHLMTQAECYEIAISIKLSEISNLEYEVSRLWSQRDISNNNRKQEEVD